MPVPARLGRHVELRRSPPRARAGGHAVTKPTCAEPTNARIPRRASTRLLGGQRSASGRQSLVAVPLGAQRRVSASATSTTSWRTGGGGPRGRIIASRSVSQPAASKNGRARCAGGLVLDLELAVAQVGEQLVGRAPSSSGSEASAPRRARSSRPSSPGADGVRSTEPCSHGSTLRTQRILRAPPGDRAARSVVVVVLAAAGAADHDLVFLDRDLDGAVARPVLGVDRDRPGRRGPATGRSPLRRGRTCPRADRRARSGGASVHRGAVAARLGFSSSSASQRLRQRRRLRPPLRRPCARPLRRRGPLLRPCDAASASSSAAICASSSARRSTSSTAAPFSSASGSRPCSRLKAWICWTVTSSWCAIHASVRPCRTHPRIWLS